MLSEHPVVVTLQRLPLRRTCHSMVIDFETSFEGDEVPSLTIGHAPHHDHVDPAIRAKSTVALAHPVKGGWHRIRLWCSGILDRNANLPEYYLVLSAPAQGVQTVCVRNVQCRLLLFTDEALEPPGDVDGEYDAAAISAFFEQFGQLYPVHLQRFVLRAGRLSGWGEDYVGNFTVEGQYDVDLNFYFLKQYVGQHSIDYSGLMHVTAEEVRLTGEWHLSGEPLGEATSTGGMGITLQRPQVAA
eukprot:EG_transcript_18506